MEKRFKFRRVNEITGAFILALLLIIAFAFFFSWRAQRWYWPAYSFQVLLPLEGAFGIRAGSEVFVLGISAGWVEEIDVEEDGRIMANVEIRRDFRRFIRVDSVARIERQFAIAGDASFDIAPGRGELLEVDGIIQAEPPEALMGDFEEMLSQLAEEAGPVLGELRGTLQEWRQLASGLGETQEQLRPVLGRLDQVTATLEEGEGPIGALLADPQLGERLRRILEDVQAGAAGLPEITTALADEAEQMTGLLLQAQQTLREIEIFFDGLQDHWLVRGYMDPDEPARRIPPPRLEGGRR
jgi:ABC-type transporter Mla subunit MlaD